LPNTLAKVAFAFCVILSIPASSYARATGSESTDQPEISGLPPDPENAGAVNTTIDPNSVSNTSKVTRRRGRVSPHRFGAVKISVVQASQPIPSQAVPSFAPTTVFIAGITKDAFRN
jgi:hypothetical protein